MPRVESDGKMILCPEDRGEWRRWLEDHFETENEIIWHVEQKTWTNRMVTDITCKKSDMLLVNYEAPNGKHLHRKLWNGGNGKGVLEEMSYTLNTTDRHAVAQPCSVGAGGADSLLKQQSEFSHAVSKRKSKHVGCIRLERCADSNNSVRGSTCSGGQITGSLCAHDGRGFNGQDVSNDKLVIEEYGADYDS